MKHLVLTYLFLAFSMPLFAQESFDYQLFRLGVQYLYEDPAPTLDFRSPLLGMRLEPNLDRLEEPEDPLFTYDGLWQDTSSGARCFQIVPSFAGWYVQQSDGATQIETGTTAIPNILIRNQESVGATWEAGTDLSGRIDSVRWEEFLGLADSVKYISFYRTTDEEPFAVPIRVSKSYGLLTGTFFWQLESTTTPLELVGISEPAAGLQITTLDNALEIPTGTELNISRVRSEITAPGGIGNLLTREQKVTPGSFRCDPVIGTREIEFTYDEFFFKTPFGVNLPDFGHAFNVGLTGIWQLNETDHGWLDAQPGEFYTSDERPQPIFVVGRSFGCLGAGKQAHYVLQNGDCLQDGAGLDVIPTGYYLPNKGGPYFTQGTFSQYLNDLVGVVKEEAICGEPFDFTNPLDTVVLGQAFPWEIFRPGVQYVYEQGEEDWLQHFGMRLTGNGEEAAYESYRGYFSGCPQQVPSFAGVRVRQEPSLTTLLFYTDSLHLRPAAQIGESWMANDTTLATVDSITMESFLGLTDSVKYISFSHQTLGTSIGTSIRIGKNYGLLTGTFFYDLSAAIPLELVGTSIEATGLQAPNFETLTAFEPGDEFHVKYIETMDSGSVVYYLHREVQYTVKERQVFAGGNVRIHLWTNELSWRIGSTMSPDSTYRERRLMTMDFDLATMPYLDYQPGQLYEEPTFGFGLVKLVPPNESNCFGANIYLEPFGGNDDGCIYPAPFHTFGNFINGLAGPYYQFVEGSHVIQRLRYADNANGICGTPIDFNGLVDGVNDFQPDERIRLYPNPSEGRINLEVPVDLGPVSLSVFSITGQRMLAFGAVSGHRAISLGPLATGMYTVVFQNAAGTVVGRRRVVKR